MAEHTLSELLARAAEAFEQYEELEVLQRLLNAWRQQREPRVAALVERLSKRLSEHLRPQWGPSDAAFMREHHPRDLPRLLPRVLELADQGHWNVMAHHLDVLAVWPADPRLTPVLVEIARRPKAIEREVFASLCKALTASVDPRALEPLRACLKTLPSDSRQAQWLRGAMEAIARWVPPPMDAETAARCEALEQALAAREAAEARSSPTREALLERVYADPGDVSARLVLADHLLEQGVPRGQLIMLQCSPGSDKARVERLLETHAPRWVTELGPQVAPGHTRFERGFPFAVRLRHDWREALPEPGPAWRTVREVNLSEVSFPNAAEWLSHPNLGGVTVLKRVTPALARELVNLGLGVRQLGLRGPVSEVAPELFGELLRLPLLTRLFIRYADPEDVRLCAASGLVSRLERFDARAPAEWALVVKPGQEVPVRATLLGGHDAEQLSRVLAAAAAFGTRGLLVRGMARAREREQRLLRAAVGAYARVEWR
ncbi:TIGR02996 domain-containing protein [Pyxidicoccus fallax]|uniref:TIGR02996 domain-containing protein n=1 Tax=Pyxidicoccus fallax TaxID=394095 RepID=A0A848LJZ3_9BACT|nr:TIGR02996 domain-containing protein [Pyxidicoccus fallax]NMO18077.1 TIGR02996 domain-containing protein [Pyxidicoccus fallax]NPC78583.1 TIGR02996 domain-containing protein [Pyxidicoccus fallax]